MSALTVNCPQCGRALRLNDSSLLGKKGKCPSCQHRFVLQAGGAASAEKAVAAPEPAEFSALEQMRARRKRGQKKNLIATAAGGLLALCAVIAFWVASRSGEEAPAKSLKSPAPAPAKVEHVEKPAPAVAAVANAPREPIRLVNVPSGAGIVINFHPAKLWQSGGRSEELRKCLGPLATWAESQLRDVSGLEPSEIDEALVCLIVGTRGAPPDVAAVIHLVEGGRSQSDLLQKYPGKPVGNGTHTISVGEKFGYFVPDNRTVAIAPKRLAEELFDSVSDPAVTDSGIEALLKETDRKRDFTIVFRPGDLQVHAEAMVPAEAKRLSDGILEWLGSETEAVAWSFQCDDPLSFELLLRNERVIGERQLSTLAFQQHVDARLQYLPAYVLDAVKQTSPPTEGRRKVVGRLPAMMKAVALATTSTTGERVARFTTTLPERAAPNLALAARLAVAETANGATRSPGQTSPDAPPPANSETVAERLKKNVEADFRRTPLEDAFIAMGGDVGVAVVIDGKALEAVGYTRNMPQEMQLGSVPATTAIAEILKKYEHMVIVLDENAKQVKVTTRAAAEKNGWTVFPVGP